MMSDGLRGRPLSPWATPSVVSTVYESLKHIANIVLSQPLSQFWVALQIIFWALLLLVAKVRLLAWPMSLLGSALKRLSLHGLADTRKLCSTQG